MSTRQPSTEEARRQGNGPPAPDAATLLRLIAEGTASSTGTEFFRSLVRSLASALDTSCAFVTEFMDGNTRVRPLAFWNAGEFLDAPEYALAGSPCETVLSGEISAFSSRVCELFPVEREALEALGAQSYLAIPIKNAAGSVLGHLAVIDRRARDWREVDFGILRIFGARTAGELERRWYERELEAANARLEREADSRTASEAALRQSEQGYRGLYEDAPVAYWAVGTDRVIKRVNKKVTEFLGYAREEIVGQSLARFTAPTPEGEGVAREVFARFLRGESTLNQEVEFRTRDGSSVWASVSVTPVFNDRGEVEVTRSVVVDITARKRAQRELEHRLALENLIATASSRFVRASGQEVDVEINHCMMEMAGFFGIERMCVYRFTNDEHRALHTHAWIAPDIKPPPDEIQCADLPALFRDVLEGRVIGVKDLDSLPPDYADLRGRLERVGVRSVAILPLDYSHRVLGMLLLESAHCEQDWSEEDLRLLRLLGEIIASTLARRDAEAALEEARRVAEAASRAKSAFLANMSHELRTPLNGILGYAQLLARDQQLDRRHVEAVLGVQHCGEHLLELVNEVLDLARIETGRIELRDEDVELAPLIDETADITRLRAAQAGLAFLYETGSTLPRAVRIDPRRLKQVLLNLLGNAIKFTSHGEVRFRVRGTHSAPARWQLRFEVEDTGVGIEPEELPRIFEPFHRAPADRAVEGTGLGLAISRDLVEAMGGTLHVESTLGRGSLFVVELELPQAEVRAAGAALPPQIAGYHGRRRTLLIADDKKDNRAMLRKLLEPLGFTTYEATNGRETLAMAGRLHPDLILLDIVMPEMDGLEVARRLRADPAVRAVRIIAISAGAFGDTRQASVQAGCDDFIAKPVRFDAVLEAVERHLGLRWIRDGEPRGHEEWPQPERQPPEEQILRLYDLSRRGDIAELNACLSDLETAGEYAQFVAELRALARSFDMKGIRERLQQIVPTVQ